MTLEYSEKRRRTSVSVYKALLEPKPPQPLNPGTNDHRSVRINQYFHHCLREITSSPGKRPQGLPSGIQGSISTALLSSGDVGQTINFPNLLIKLCLKVWKQPIQDGHVVDVLYGSRYTPEAKCNIIVKQEPHTPLMDPREHLLRLLPRELAVHNYLQTASQDTMLLRSSWSQDALNLRKNCDQFLLMG
ncbi:uncharacterized protein K444DRAFT_623213 [Hyaloscypha bicolor E]|uniref:Uncharacterized protein n=1 Tax=Hyaloscypha bicolor E TaxID=1095630 RepID=A0A2J6TVC0_9HELO|nr:uncharacterized protein K444DRAFT_623213 [Hyaloscypha bicolor E]PMD66966.1 hypothetical protein K444DRAFT_623213 [Hyaloscypha bicolor E]